MKITTNIVIIVIRDVAHSAYQDYHAYRGALQLATQNVVLSVAQGKYVSPNVGLSPVCRMCIDKLCIK